MGCAHIFSASCKHPCFLKRGQSEKKKKISNALGHQVVIISVCASSQEFKSDGEMLTSSTKVAMKSYIR